MALHPVTAMIKTQLETNAILDARIEAAFEAVLREDFTPKDFSRAAYVDRAIPVSAGRAMLEPLTLARLLDLAELKPEDHVLVIGDATGFTTAVCAQLVGEVTCYEEEEACFSRIQSNIEKNALPATVHLLKGDWMRKPADLKAPSVVVIEGSVEQLPQWMIDVLADGGRVICISSVRLRPGADSGLGLLTKIAKNDTAIEKTTYQDVFAHHLVTLRSPSGFTF
jgi:protein-L-isoaspartate(D-aspartate) O-methyltransferase